MVCGIYHVLYGKWSMVYYTMLYRLNRLAFSLNLPQSLNRLAQPCNWWWGFLSMWPERALIEVLRIPCIVNRGMAQCIPEAWLNA